MDLLYDEMFYELEIIVHLLTFKQDCKFTIYLWYQLFILSRSAIFSKVLIEWDYDYSTTARRSEQTNDTILLADAAFRMEV